ncbi:hypothetical protein N7457_004212 [Penicillium paradoxum]|uniref:uncharacterized protein n=1 Tax=Penicillium paradoxum TaxID=176176 RepID=UPI002548FC8E|nr:uncharacterized protein N7457_004212 [Penicillium paradoxum]KAJ5782438.1 hypothetical protein N7457_004212 [Penicillium paradoxum]
MDGLSSAASIIAVIQVAGSVVKICGGYIKEVKDARDEILKLQQTVTDLLGVLQQLESLLEGPNSSKLSRSQDQKQIPKGHSLDWSVTFSPDSRLLASGSDKTVRLLEVTRGAL